MNRITLSLLAVLALAIGCSTYSSGGPRSLFNGRDLSGWVKMYDGDWSVEDGVLVGRKGINRTTNPEKSGSWLRTEKEYGDFIFELEYAVNERGNSGIFLRSGLEKNPAFTGYEVQILDDHGRAPAKFTSGSLYDVVAPTKNMSRPPGEWNQVRIEARGAQVKVTINGEQVVDFQTSRSLRGYLGLQNHDDHAVIKFRNVRITEL